MRFLELGITDFLSFGKREAVDLSEIGLYLICGENGVGKSTILDALSFAFYGTPVRDINLPKLVNEQIQCNLVVDLKFELNGSIYWIERYRKHEKYKDALRIYKDTHDEAGVISKTDVKDAQEQLDGLIKMNSRAFLNTIMLTQEDISGFIESTPAKKKEIIESILQLDSFTKYHKIAQDKRKIMKATVDCLSSDMKSSERIVDNIKKSMADYIESCKAQKVNDKKIVAKLNNELADLKKITVDEEFTKIKEAEELTQKKNKLQSDRQTFIDRIKLLNKELESLNNSIDEYRSLISTSNKRIEKTKRDATGVMKRKNDLQAKIDKAIANPESCPFCGGVVNAELHQKYIDDNKKTIDEIKQSITDYAHSIEAEKTSIADWDKKIDELMIKKDNLSFNITSEIEASNKIKNEYDSIIIPDTMDISELQEIADKISSVETKIKAYDDKEYVDKNYVNTTKAKLIEAMTELEKVKVDYNVNNRKLILLQFWEDSLSSKKNSIKSWCINNIVGYFNAQVKYYIDRFFEGQVSIQFDNELNEVVKFKNYDRDFKQFSGGQRRRLNIAILFALHSLVKANVSNKIDIMFLDEVLSNYLDDKGISIVLNLLEDMKDNKESVWVIDHKDNFKNFPAFKRVDVWLDNNNFSHIRIN